MLHVGSTDYTPTGPLNIYHSTLWQKVIFFGDSDDDTRLLHQCARPTNAFAHSIYIFIK